MTTTPSPHDETPEALRLTPRDPVVEIASQVLADILSRRGGRWRPAPQWHLYDPAVAAPVTGPATTSPRPTTPKDTNR